VTTATMTPEAQTQGGHGDDEDNLTHWRCCVKDRALCGAKSRPDDENIRDEDVNCVVCRAMEDQPCEVTCVPWLRGAS
jgi:hypothetical protein